MDELEAGAHPRIGDGVMDAVVIAAMTTEDTSGDRHANRIVRDIPTSIDTAEIRRFPHVGGE
jgi:hypothetical protein